MNFADMLQDELIVEGLAQETVPLIVCSTDYRMRFMRAVGRAEDALTSGEVAVLASKLRDAESEVEKEEALRKDAESDLRSARREVGDLEEKVAHLEQERDDLIAQLKTAIATENAAQ